MLPSTQEGRFGTLGSTTLIDDSDLLRLEVSRLSNRNRLFAWSYLGLVVSRKTSTWSLFRPIIPAFAGADQSFLVVVGIPPVHDGPESRKMTNHSVETR